MWLGLFILLVGWFSRVGFVLGEEGGSGNRFRLFLYLAVYFFICRMGVLECLVCDWWGRKGSFTCFGDLCVGDRGGLLICGF